MSFAFWKKTPVTLYHKTNAANADAIHQSGTIFGSREDRNDACGRVGLSKVWVCAESDSDFCCSRRASQRFLITASDLMQISNSWSAYRTKDSNGYRVEGHHRTFYNFFLVPDSLSLPARCMKKLYSADLDDDDPIQFFWNDGDMFVLEKRVLKDEAMTSTTTYEDSDEANPDNEQRSFHVAIVCWNLCPDSAQEDTMESTSNGDNGMEDEEDSTEMDDENATEDSDDTNEERGHYNNRYNYSSSDSTTSESDAADYKYLPLTKRSKRPQFGTNAFSVVPRKMPELPPRNSACIPRRSWNLKSSCIQLDNVRKRLLISVGTSKRALSMSSTEQNEELVNFDDAAKMALDHASSRFCLTLQDVIEWHKKLLQANRERAGLLRDKTQARCGLRVFVPGAQVYSQLSCFLEALNQGVNSGCSEQDLAAWALWYFLVIHPFSDGNGRLSRLLVAWILVRKDVPQMVSPLCTPGKRRDSFVEAIRQVDATGGEDLQPLVLHMKSCYEGQ